MQVTINENRLFSQKYCEQKSQMTFDMQRNRPGSFSGQKIHSKSSCRKIAPEREKVLFTILSHFERWHISCRSAALALSLAHAGTYQKVFLFGLIITKRHSLSLICSSWREMKIKQIFSFFRKLPQLKRLLELPRAEMTTHHKHLSL